MICLSSDGRLFGLNPQFLFDIFVFFANIFILLIFIVPIVVLFIFICKFNKGEDVSLSILLRICEYLNCDIGEICEAVQVSKK